MERRTRGSDASSGNASTSDPLAACWDAPRVWGAGVSLPIHAARQSTEPWEKGRWGGAGGGWVNLLVLLIIYVF